VIATCSESENGEELTVKIGSSRVPIRPVMVLERSEGMKEKFVAETDRLPRLN
jgi:hypothetical protein